MPEYLASALARRVAEARARGIDVISLGVGDPDLPPPPGLREALAEELARDDVHGYPVNRGLAELREALAAHYLRRFGVVIDPEREVIPLLGAKEGLAHLALAMLDPGDVALVADPGYPVYVGGPALAGAEAVPLPLLARNDFLPDLEVVPAQVAGRANLLVCGYPNNPTGAVAPLGFHTALAAWGDQHQVPICHDNAYAELWFGDEPPRSFLEAPGAREAGIEIYSLSKALNIPGWRVAFAVGNAAMVENLRRHKAQIDAGMWGAMQLAAARALTLVPDASARMREVYRRRRDLAVAGLRSAGLRVPAPAAGIYLWVPVPDGQTSLAFSERLFEHAAVVVAPGTAYGAAGEGYVRLALTVSDERLAEAVERISRHLAG